MKIADFLWPRSIAAEGPGSIALFDTRPRSAESLAARLRQHYPALRVAIRDNDPAGYDLLVNATAASSRAIASSGTESLLTLCWRGMDSNFLFRARWKSHARHCTRSAGCRPVPSN